MPKRKERADHRYQGKIRIATIDGKPKYKYVYAKSEKELKDKLAVLRVELGKGADLTQNMTLSFWIDRWVSRAQQTQTDDWHATCETRANYWKAALGKADITRLTTADLEDVLLELAKKNPKTGKPSSKKTLNEYVSVIRRVFALAVKNRAITFDPSAFLEKDKAAPRSTRTAITDAQIAAIRQTPHECRLPCLLMIYTGLRFGEMAALTWTDIDLPGRTLTVNKSFNCRTLTVKPPKTAAGERVVPIPEILAQILAGQKHTSMLVCTHGGAVWNHSTWANSFANYQKQLGFETSAHCLRHTYATILYEAGVDVLTAQHFMGHADSQTTMKIYTHLRDTKKAASIAKLNAFLSPESAKKAAPETSDAASQK